MDDNEVLDLIREFLIESNENPARLEQEMLALEQRPNDLALLGSVFRTIHTIKGTCGFLGFERLEGHALACQFRSVHPASAGVILVEAGQAGPVQRPVTRRGYASRGES